MLHYQVITLFPELFDSFSRLGLFGRSIEDGLVNLNLLPLRQFAINAQGQVDDSPYGGGSGMVLRPESAALAIEAGKAKNPRAKVVLLSPRGQPFTQQLARTLVGEHLEKGTDYLFLCPRYEGVDERIAKGWVDYEISIGDYILMGGEIAAMVIIEAMTRLLPGVLGNAESLTQESFERGLLEYPQYTKPAEFRGHEVPEVLRSGNHQAIDRFRTALAISDTIARRPELLDQRGAVTCNVFAALIHHPVVDKNGKTITSSITHLDLHDIARSAKTFGINQFYAAHPVKLMRRLAEKIQDHWETGFGLTYNPNRSEALKELSVVTDLDDILLDIEQRTGQFPKLITTSAQSQGQALTYTQARAILRSSTAPHLLIFGTGWGLSEEIIKRADYHLAPIKGYGKYNHLSVRAAAAIIFDRLLAPRESISGSRFCGVKKVGTTVDENEG